MATNKCTPRQTILRISVVANSAITTPAISTIPFNPANRNSDASITSVSHSHAYQGAPGFENEYRS